MLLEHWRERWLKNEIGFHQERVNPYLMRYWPRLKLASGAPVFVPLCGKSLDMVWLHDQGHPVLGIEVSPVAVKGFFEENDLQTTPVEVPPFSGWEADGLRLLCGDFFELRPRHLEGTAAVYDRASMIALPEQLRGRYAEHLMELTWPLARVLLVTLSYPEGEMTGPPFSVTEEEVNQRYGQKYRVELLESVDVLEDNARFKEKGLTSLAESVYLLSPRT